MKLFLDVDGVVSPMPLEDQLLPLEWGTWDVLDVPWRWTHLNLSRSMGTVLASLPVDLWWLTTWDDRANEFVSSHFGWANLPIAERKPLVSPWGKYEAILDSFKAGDYLEPFVWIEDEIVVIEDQIRGTLDVLGMPYLLVSPEIG